MQNITQINGQIPEGKLLLTTLRMLQQKIFIMGNVVQGDSMNMDEMLRLVASLATKLHEYEYPVVETIPPVPSSVVPGQGAGNHHDPDLPQEEEDGSPKMFLVQLHEQTGAIVNVGVFDPFASKGMDSLAYRTDQGHIWDEFSRNYTYVPVSAVAMRNYLLDPQKVRRLAACRSR
jgi:hypothetical protein